MVDLYIPGSSWLHRLDPRVKLWGVFVGILVIFLFPDPLLQAGCLLVIHLLLLRAGIPWSSLRWLWQQIGVVLGVILILQPFFLPSGHLLIGFGPLQLTIGGLVSACVLALRVAGMAFITGALLFTTAQQALVRAFVRLGLPYTWGLTLSLTLRFLPAIQNLFVKVREAQAARGWVVKGNFFQRARDYIPVVVAAIIGTIRLSDHLALALAARGFGSAGERTVWRDISMRPSDWLAFIILTVLFLFASCLYFCCL